jgi:hypothetical protein
MVRKQIYLRSDQDAWLKRLALETGLSEAELIRQALDRRLRGLPRPGRNLAAWEAEMAYLRQLDDEPVAPGGRSWKRDDLYDR